MRRVLSIANALLLLLILVCTAACGGEAPTGTPAPAPGAPAPPPAADADAGGPSSAPAGAATSTTAAAAPTSDPAGAPAVNYGLPNPATYQSPLMAGQVDDNAKFSDYLDYIAHYQGPAIHPIAVDRRLFVRVVDGQQHPVAGARVQLFDGDRAVFDGRTVSDGRVLFFPHAVDATQATQFRAVISRGQQHVEATVAASAPETTVSLSKLDDNSGPVGLDLVFLLDATGSMGDEIAQINATVAGIAARIEQLPGSSAPRFGLVAFRDRGDDYVTRSWDFTPDVRQFQANLANVQAAGGGDNPESVNAGLHDAIHLPGWATQDSGRHLRMIVLVGDAPPHLDYANDYEYTTLLQEAVAAGIKIFPIGASGLDDQGEYIFRQFAQVTQGQFVFLTYANGVAGAPGAGTDHQVSDFSVEHLDGLVVRLVAGEIANQTGTAAPGGAGSLAVPVGAAPPASAAPAATPAPAQPPVPVVLLAGFTLLMLAGGSILGHTNILLWLVILMGWGLWYGWHRAQARRAVAPGVPFAAPVGERGRAARVLAAARLAATTAPPPAGAATTPLPSLPDKVRRA